MQETRGPQGGAVSDEFRALAAGNRLTHNHPSGKTLGPEDIDFVLDWGLAETRAAVPGKTFVMEMRTQGMDEADRYLLKTLAADTRREQVAVLRQVSGIAQLPAIERNHMLFEQTWNALSAKRPDVFKYYTVPTKR